MYRNRFQLIHRYLHFNDNNAAGTNEDRLYKIRTILDIVLNNFRTTTRSRQTGVAKKKPKCFIDYNNHNMHGVDTADQYLAYYPFIRKTVKWPKKVFFFLLQCCLF